MLQPLRKKVLVEKFNTSLLASKIIASPSPHRRRRQLLAKVVAIGEGVEEVHVGECILMDFFAGFRIVDKHDSPAHFDMEKDGSASPIKPGGKGHSIDTSFAIVNEEDIVLSFGTDVTPEELSKVVEIRVQSQ